MAKIYLRPNGRVGIAALSRNTGTSNWSCLDEVTPNDAVDYVFYVSDAGIDTSLEDEYTLTDASAIPDGSTINFGLLRSRGYSEPSGSTREFRCGIHSGAVYDRDSYHTPGAIWTTYEKTYLTDPNTGLAWTKAALTALQGTCNIHVNGTAGSPAEARVTWYEFEVDYTPPPVQPVNVNVWNGPFTKDRW